MEKKVPKATIGMGLPLGIALGLAYDSMKNPDK
jgi:hypothetical protein